MAIDHLSGALGQGADRKTALSTTLRQRILTMQVAPGAVLDEVALSEEFGLSRPPVREAMRQLAGEGFIELEANRPARAASMSYRTLRDFFLVAPMIYIAATRLAAENASKADIAGLRDIQDEFRAAVRSNDVDSRVFQNDRFHLRIGEVADNAFLLPSLRRLLIDHARIGKIFYAPAMRAWSRNWRRPRASTTISSMPSPVMMPTAPRCWCAPISTCRVATWRCTPRRRACRCRWSADVSPRRSASTPRRRRAAS